MGQREREDRYKQRGGCIERERENKAIKKKERERNAAMKRSAVAAEGVVRAHVLAHVGAQVERVP